MILPAVETVEEAVICLKGILSIYGEIPPRSGKMTPLSIANLGA